MNGLDVSLDDQGQDDNNFLNDDLVNLFNIDVARDEILSYLDGSALINLTSVSRAVRGLVSSSPIYQNRVNLRVATKSEDIFTSGLSTCLGGWLNNLRSLTLVYEPELFFPLKKPHLNLAQNLDLPALTHLEVSNEHQCYIYYPNLYKIISLASNLKSLTIPYDLMPYHITFNLLHAQNLEHVKFTTSTYKFKFDEQFEENLEILTSNCFNLKSFACQEVAKEQGEYIYEYGGENYHTFLNGILTIIENNSRRLEKLELGISTLLIESTFSSKLTEISLSNLKFLDLSAVTPKDMMMDTRVLDILHNLPRPGLLTTLKLTLISCPLELFDLIPLKFSKLKSLSLKASRYNTPGPNQIIDEFRWSFLQSLTQLKELEISKWKIDSTSTCNFGSEISQKFPDFLQKNDLRKLSMKGMNITNNGLFSFSFSNQIAKMDKLIELRLTGLCVDLDDFLMICKNLRFLEKLEISCLNTFEDFYHHQTEKELKTENYNPKISTVFSSLRYLKELSIEFSSGCDFGFRQMFGSTSFPYLKSLTLCNANLDKEELENIIGLNGMLKELNIISLKFGDRGQDENFETRHERKNFKIDFTTKE